MKLTIERAALLKALAHVQSVVERRNTIPILSNVLITAQKGRLSLAATDMDLAITETVEATAAKSGSTTAPAHTLYEIVRKLPDGAQVELETSSDGNSLAIRAGRSRFTLQCLPPADFPAMNEGDLPYRFQLPATDLKGIIDRTMTNMLGEKLVLYGFDTFTINDELVGTAQGVVIANGTRVFIDINQVLLPPKK